MKHFGLLTIFICLSLTAAGKKFVFPIEVVAGVADLIVIGEITQIAKATYEFNVTETIKGEQYDVISVEKFVEWECDERFAKHELGQRLFLFLKRSLNTWTIINGSTGEIPIINGELTLINEEYKHVDYQYHPYKLKLTEFTDGIKRFVKCFKFMGEYELLEDKPKFKQLCQEERVKIFTNTNKFTIWLYERLKDYVIESA